MRQIFQQSGTREVAALLVGLAVGIAAMEALLAAANRLGEFGDIDQLIFKGAGLPGTASLVFFTGWGLAGALGSVIATAISGSRTTGYVLGALLMAPTLVLGTLSGMPGAQVSALTITPLVCAAAGAWAAGWTRDRRLRG